MQGCPDPVPHSRRENQGWIRCWGCLGDGGAEALGRSLSFSVLRADGGAQGGALPIFLLSMM